VIAVVVGCCGLNQSWLFGCLKTLCRLQCLFSCCTLHYSWSLKLSYPAKRPENTSIFDN
jgi:hypothetical protein